MIHCQVKDLPQSVDTFYTYLNRISKGIQFYKEDLFFFPGSWKNPFISITALPFKY